MGGRHLTLSSSSSARKSHCILITLSLSEAASSTTSVLARVGAADIIKVKRLLTQQHSFTAVSAHVHIDGASEQTTTKMRYV